MIREIFDFLYGLGRTAAGYACRFAVMVWEWFCNLVLPEKMIVIMIIPAFFAAVLSVARIPIFDSWYYINSPFAVHMIGIVFLMLASSFYTGRIVLGIRLGVNFWYLFWMILVYVSGDLVRCKPHELLAGYYINITVPLVYSAIAVWSHLVWKKR